MYGREGGDTYRPESFGMQRTRQSGVIHPDKGAGSLCPVAGYRSLIRSNAFFFSLLFLFLTSPLPDASGSLSLSLAGSTSIDREVIRFHLGLLTCWNGRRRREEEEEEKESRENLHALVPDSNQQSQAGKRSDIITTGISQ